MQSSPLPQNQAGEITPIADLSLYQLQPGDEVKILVYGEDDLSGIYKLSGDGAISFPLLGIIRLHGATIYDVKSVLTQALGEGYLKHPDVSVEVKSYRPYSVLGAVENAGQYEYAEGVVVGGAIASAGGFSGRAQTDSFEVLRRTEQGWQRLQISIQDPLYPGDILYIGHKAF